MPYQESIEQFEKTYLSINTNSDSILKEKDLEYLEEYYKKKQSWAKCFMIHDKLFTCGICTTQSLIKYFKSIVSNDILEKMKFQFQLALSYNVTDLIKSNILENNSNKWLVFFLTSL